MTIRTIAIPLDFTTGVASVQASITKINFPVKKIRFLPSPLNRDGAPIAFFLESDLVENNPVFSDNGVNGEVSSCVYTYEYEQPRMIGGQYRFTQRSITDGTTLRTEQITISIMAEFHSEKKKET